MTCIANIITDRSPPSVNDESISAKPLSALIRRMPTIIVEGNAIARPSRAFAAVFPADPFSAADLIAAGQEPISSKGRKTAVNISAGKSLRIFSNLPSVSPMLS